MLALIFLAVLIIVVSYIVVMTDKEVVDSYHEYKTNEPGKPLYGIGKDCKDVEDKDADDGRSLPDK